MRPDLARRFEPLLTARDYDPGLRAPEGKAGLLAGMAMTEKQGGSDVRANTTRAEPAPGDGPGAHLLTGHKWFCSAPMCDLFLVLAQAPAGLTCFLLPRVLPDGDPQRHAHAAAQGQAGQPVQRLRRGRVRRRARLAGRRGRAAACATIIEMVSATRLDCVLGSAAGMRLGCVTAVHYASAPARRSARA